MSALAEKINLWALRLRGIAQTGLAFEPPVYDRERYEELLGLAAEIASTSEKLEPDAHLSSALQKRWRDEVQNGIPGYVTPKIGIGAVVFNAQDEILLIERPSHHWLFPTGWADIGYTPAQVAVKEVCEETGLDITPERLMAVYDIRTLLEQDLDQQLYSLVFYCRLNGGELRLRPHEALNGGFYRRDALPQPLGLPALGWVEHAWAAHRDARMPAYFM